MLQSSNATGFFLSEVLDNGNALTFQASFSAFTSKSTSCSPVAANVQKSCFHSNQWLTQLHLCSVHSHMLHRCDVLHGFFSTALVFHGSKKEILKSVLHIGPTFQELIENVYMYYLII